MHPKDLVFMYCPISQIKKIGFTLKKDILKELSVFLRLNLNKNLIEKIFSKINYNNILFFIEMGFNLNIINKNNNYYLIFKNAIEIPEILIKKQTYFNYKILSKLKEKTIIGNYFDSLGFFNENIKIDFIYDPFFKIQTKIYLNEKDYIMIEYFEKNNVDKFTGILSDKLRIGNILNFSQEEKCKRFYVFWENYINDEVYFNNYVDNIVNFINDYHETPMTYLMKNNLIDKRNLSGNYLLMLLDDNKIKKQEIIDNIKWKDPKLIFEFNVLFSATLLELGLEDNEYLELESYNLFIQKLSLIFVEDEKEINYWTNLSPTINKIYQIIMKEYIKTKLHTIENSVYGLDDYRVF
jgi:hypothetical protein